MPRPRTVPTWSWASSTTGASYDAHLDQGSLIAAAPVGYDFPDQDGIFQNSLLVGGAYQGVVRNVHTVKSGIEAEASAEWGPFAPSDFLRLNATARFFLPIWDAAPDRDRNLFSVYAGDFVSVDLVIGDAVPLNIRQSFGGQSPRTGLGGAVRGVDSGSLDGYFKAVNNLEVRVVGPALFLPAIVPGLVAYVDAGLFGSAGSPVPKPGDSSRRRARGSSSTCSTSRSSRSTCTTGSWA